MKPNRRVRQKQTETKKPGEDSKSGGSNDEETESNLKGKDSKKKWVCVTRKDVLKLLTPEQRKQTENCLRAVSCSDKRTAYLTPEQKALRTQYRAEKWPEYDAMQAALDKSGNEAKHVQAVNALQSFAQQANWFAVHTPHPFKVSYWSYIATLAEVSCQYLQQLAQNGNQEAISRLAQLTVQMTETLNDLLTGDPVKVKGNAAQMRREAAELPYWPMLQFRHAAANNHFPVVADLLELGKDCPINATERANYSLQTPINRFVWRCLRRFQEVHGMLRSPSRIHPTSEQNLEPYSLPREEIPMYVKSSRLDPLTKRNAQEWADVAIMPFIKRRFPDLREVEELSYLKKQIGATGKRYAPVRKAVIQALQQLARKP